jgi:hypothetical protein
MPPKTQRESCVAISLDEVWTIPGGEDRFVTDRQETGEDAREAFLDADEEPDGALRLICPASVGKIPP